MSLTATTALYKIWNNLAMSEPPPLSPIRSTTPFGDPSDPLISADYTGWWQKNKNLFQAYWRQLAVLQGIGALAALVLRVPAAVVQAIQTRGLRDSGQLDRTAIRHAVAEALPALTIGTVGSILAGLLLALVSLAGMRLLVTGVTGGEPAVPDALRGALGRLFPLVGWSLLAGLILLLGFCACFVPALYFAAVFTVLPAVVLFERGGVIVRCFKLFHADFSASIARVATVIGIAIAASLLSSSISTVVNTVAQAWSAGTGGLVSGTLIGTVFQVAVTAALGVLLTPLVLTTYADERARLEPLHTGVLAHELSPTP
jgi:hypothetical protein